MSSSGPPEPVDPEALEREVLALRVRVAELQRAAARHQESDGVSLAEREELLREAERIAHLGTWTWEPESGRVTWSDELYRILGHTPGSVTPSVEAFFAAVHPDDQARAQAATARSLEDGVLPLVDCRVIRPDGSIRYTTSSSSMLFDAEGVPRRIVGGVLDRTESREAEATLRRTLGLLEEAQRFAQLGSWRFDPVRGDLEWSKEFRRIAGLPLDVSPSVAMFMDLVVPEDRPRMQAAHAQSLSTLQGQAVDLRLRRPDGQLRHVRLDGFGVETAEGQRELRGTLLDITDQVRMREELLHAQKMEAIGRLAGGIAHDFNNLLTIVTCNLQLLVEELGPRAELDTSLSALASAASLTQRLLAFGRKAHLTLKRVDPNALVQSTAAMMRRLVGDEVHLELTLAPDLPSIRVDHVEIERALVNLVINARNVTPPGGVVQVGTACEDGPDGVTVALTVSDQGPGVAEPDRARIFEPFFTTRAQHGGTGLGLATVLGTAEQHGGTVRVENRPQGGSEFAIVLPAATASGDAEATEAEGPTPDARVDTRALRLLLVDDEPDVAMVTRTMLERRGHQVRITSDPTEALALWSSESLAFDLVICDVAMAKMRGPELIEQMGRVGAQPRVLYITGYSEEAVRAELGHPVLAKPFTTASLWRAVAEASR